MNRRLTPFLWALNALLLAALALLWFGPGAGQRTQWVAPQPLPLMTTLLPSMRSELSQAPSGTARVSMLSTGSQAI